MERNPRFPTLRTLLTLDAVTCILMGGAAHMVVLGNALWVVASVALPVSGVLAPNLPGWICLLAQAGVVALLAVLEFEAAQRSGRALA